MDDKIIRLFPGEPPTASEDPYLESIAAHADAVNAINGIIKTFKPKDQQIIIAASLGAVLCEYGKTPSRSLAIALLGPTLEMLLEYIDGRYGKRDGQFS